ncbi:MAG: hypothetical protein AVDCRST_MAG49-878, partial [uncultured Thermomicrobiales bacterium]
VAERRGGRPHPAVGAVVASLGPSAPGGGTERARRRPADGTCGRRRL